jgi:acyl-CoA reductase-like NAD-dependent aldehyde dehydrogenase
MPSYAMLIDGQSVTTQQQIDVINPATGQVFAQAPRADEVDLNRAVEAARAAYATWSATTIDDRRAVLLAVADRIEANAAELTALFTSEQGRPTQGAGLEIGGASVWLRAVANMVIPVEVIEAPGQTVEVHHDPLGVIGAIVPWNFPVTLAIWKIAPALLAGNTMVLKPSPFTPLCMLRIGELVRDVVPAGVLNIITGGDELGPWLTAHAGFDKISFTGSSATGRKVMEMASKDLKRVTLELGGNDAAIILPDVDLDAVAERIFFGAFFNSSQICVATKRMYIHADIYDALRDRLVAMAKAAPVGDGSQQGIAFGPIQNAPQYARVKKLLEQAEAEGLTVLKGGDVPEDGYFIPLTIIDNPPEDSAVVQEEAFGPLLPLMRYDDLDAVIAKANDSEYGLAGAVWSADVDKAKSVARRLDTGTVWVNTNLAMLPSVPFAGRRPPAVWSWRREWYRRIVGIYPAKSNLSSWELNEAREAKEPAFIAGERAETVTTAATNRGRIEEGRPVGPAERSTLICFAGTAAVLP